MLKYFNFASEAASVISMGIGCNTPVTGLKRSSNEIHLKAKSKVHRSTNSYKRLFVTGHAYRRTWFLCKSGFIGMRTAAPLGGSKWLTHWISEIVYWSEAAGPPQDSPLAT